MEFSSLVLMERNKEGQFVRELGSYTVPEGADYITKLFLVENEVSMYFDCGRDVEEWEFSAIYDVFDLEKFNSLGYLIEEDTDEYNPTWIVKFEYEDEHEEMGAIINELCNLIKDSIEKAFKDIEGLEEEYK